MNNKDIIQVSNKTITKYSSDVIKRGLNLANSIENINTSQQSYLKQGISFFEKKEYKQAINYFDEEIKVNPNSSLAWGWRGSALTKLYEEEKAIKSFERAVELNPSNADIRYWQGNALFKCLNYTSEFSEWQSALILYNKVIEIKPNYHNSLFWIEKALILDKLKNHEEAIFSHNKAIAIEKNECKIHNFLLSQADRLYNLERYQEAIIFHDKAMKLDSDNYSMWLRRGKVLKELHRYEEANFAYDQAIKIDHKYAYHLLIYINKAEILELLKKDDEAILFYARAIQSDFIRASSELYEKGLNYFNKQKLENSKRSYQKKALFT